MAVRFYNYLKLAHAGTPYAKRVEQLSSRIFGEVVRPTSSKSMKVSINVYCLLALLITSPL